MFKYFRAFRAVYENRNFSAAAKQIFVSQSSVSQQIKKLERLLGAPLFTRNSRSQVIPTSLADQLYQNGVNLFEQQLALQKRLTAHHQRQIICRLGVSHTNANLIIPLLLKKLSLPTTINLTISVANSSVIAEQIQHHQLELGLIEKPIVTPEIERVPFYQDELVHAGNFDSPLWLERESGSGVYHYTEEFFKQQKIRPPKITHINNNDLIIKCLQQGLGQSIVSKAVIPSSIPFHSLGTNFKRQFFLLKRPRYQTAELAKFINSLTNLLKNTTW